VISITREYHWPMGHRLRNHRGRCRFAHGHSYVAHVTVEATTDIDRPGRTDDGMVMDFSVLEAVLREAVGTPWDHAFMLEDGDPLVAMFAMAEANGDAQKVVVVECPPTAENIARIIKRNVQALLGTVGRVTRVTVYEGPKSAATCEGGA
jgi:6-pyruvoyltetrahydropterin/6-carboxytetrahydropterin synthase